MKEESENYISMTSENNTSDKKLLLYNESNFDRDREYWNQFYLMSAGKLTEPSNFAYFALNYLKPEKSLMELGCGNGRDSVFF